jgi:translation initiation factor 5A
MSDDENTEATAAPAVDEANIDDDFAQGEAGASHCYPSQAGNVKKNGYCMLQGFPCKVTEMSTSKAGKHGHAKATIVGVDIFTGKKYEDSAPTSHNVEIPFVRKNEYTLIDIADDGFITLLTDGGETKEDLKLPEDDAEEVNRLKEEFAAGKDILVTVMSAMGKEKVISHREVTTG